jgi:hypothetical protein
MHFRVFLLNRSGHIEMREEVEAETDEAAIAIGKDLLRRNPIYAGLEIWDRKRVVHKEMHKQ